MDEISPADDEGSSLSPVQSTEEPHERFNPLSESTPRLSSTVVDHIPSLCYLLLSCISLVLFTSGLVITSYPYLQAVKGPSDTYNGLLVVMCFTFLPLMMVLSIRRILLHRESLIWPESMANIFKLGCLYGLAFLMIVFAIDDMRVLCHLQEPLMGLVIIYLIVIYFVYKGPEINLMKMFCMCGLLASLFLSMNYQLNDVYSCRGKHRVSPADDGRDWSEEAHTLWMLIYALGLFWFTLAWLLLENEIIMKKNGSMTSRITRASHPSHFENGDIEALLDASYEGVPEIGFEGRPLSPPSYGSIMARWDTHVIWFLASTCLFVLAMFWTDFIPNLGEVSSVEGLITNFAGAIQCFFSNTDDCGMVWLYGWLFVASQFGFFVSLGYVFANCGSMIFALSVASLSLPISSFFWTIFEIGGNLGITLHPQISGQLIFTSLGFPLMVSCLMYWVYIDRKQKAETNNVLVV